MAAPNSRQILIRVTTMLAVPLVCHEDSHDRCGRRVTRKVAEDDRPGPNAQLTIHSCFRDQRTKSKTQEEASGVTHEDACRRPVENQKSEAAHCEQGKDELQSNVG